MAAWVRSRENSLSREDSRCRCGWAFSWVAAGQFFADGGEAQPALVQDLGGEALFFSQQTQQQMFGANVAVREPLGFFGGIGQHSLALVAEREIHGGGDLLADGGVPLDLLADGFHRGMRTEEPVGEGLVFAQKSQKQVLSLDIRRPELAGFVAREKDDAPGFLRIAFKHNALPLTFPVEKNLKPLDLPEP